MTPKRCQRVTRVKHTHTTMLYICRVYLMIDYPQPHQSSTRISKCQSANDLAGKNEQKSTFWILS